MKLELGSSLERLAARRVLLDRTAVRRSVKPLTR